MLEKSWKYLSNGVLHALIVLNFQLKKKTEKRKIGDRLAIAIHDGQKNCVEDMMVRRTG